MKVNEYVNRFLSAVSFRLNLKINLSKKILLHKKHFFLKMEKCFIYFSANNIRGAFFQRLKIISKHFKKKVSGLK